VTLNEALIVLRDAELEFLVRAVLVQHGYNVRTTPGGAAALHAVAESDPSLIVVAEIVDDMSTPSLVSALRSRSGAYLMVADHRRPEQTSTHSNPGTPGGHSGPGHNNRGTPGDLTENVSGADEYLPSPLSLRDLAARVGTHQAMVASGAASAGLLSCGDLRINLPTREAWWRAHPLSLTKTEFDLLTILASTPRRVHTKAQLLGELPAPNHPAQSHAIAMHVSNLRRKLRAAGAQHGPLRTVRGVGYKCDPDWD